MKHTSKLVALILTFLMLAGSTTAYSDTYVSEQVTPRIANPGGGEALPETPEEALSTEESDATQEQTEVHDEAAMADETAEETAEGEAVVQTKDKNGAVNIRAVANSEAEIIGQLTNGMRVVVLGAEGEWMLVRAAGIIGYVHASYLKNESTEPRSEEEAVDISNLKVEIFSSLDEQVSMGETIRLTSVLSGFDGIEYALQWQYNDGSGWKNIPGATEGHYEFKATLETVQYAWRLTVTI